MRGEDGIIVGWILRIVVGVAIAGLLLFEAGAVVIATVNADNAARSAAQEAVATYAHSHNLEDAKKDAQKQAAAEDAVVVEFSATSAGAGGQSSATVTVRKTAKTLFIHKIGFLKRFASSTATSTAYSV
jgi:mannitol-specific phosphotransferase system IIBC component